MSRSARMFEAFVERAGDGFALLTADGVVQHASRAFASCLGLGADDLKGMTLRWQVAPDDRVGLTTWEHLLLDTPGRALPFRASFRRRDGSNMPLRATGLNLLADADVQAVAVCFADEGA